MNDIIGLSINQKYNSLTSIRNAKTSFFDIKEEVLRKIFEKYNDDLKNNFKIKINKIKYNTDGISNLLATLLRKIDYKVIKYKRRDEEYFFIKVR